jgi:lipopolysaccharide transport system ATP-binding protein
MDVILNQRSIITGGFCTFTALRPILEIKNISKKYQIQGNTKPYLSLRESVFSFLKPSSKLEEFWALKDVSFDVMPGDTVGIIGKNGAGKSTLLKVLSRITPPTNGSIISRGRIASLLEVGTGFHPELSGRENIFLNGSILGMKRTEIQSQFDAIVDFSGVEKFIDTPLKHYSSGMQLRLAFAVAAFLEPEVLIIDEVLAVGDAEFQKKCLGKMKDVSNSGRTVLFVSHNIGALKSLCSKGIILKQGAVNFNGEINAAIDLYLRASAETTTSLVDLKKYSGKNPEAAALSIECKTTEGVSTNSFFAGDFFSIEVTFELFKYTPQFVIGIGVMSEEGAQVRTVWTRPQNLEAGKHKVIYKENRLYFGAGRYSLHVGLSSNEINLQYISDCYLLNFEISVNKELALRTDCGFVLNQMDYEII